MAIPGKELSFVCYDAICSSGGLCQRLGNELKSQRMALR